MPELYEPLSASMPMLDMDDFRSGCILMSRKYGLGNVLMPMPDMEPLPDMEPTPDMDLPPDMEPMPDMDLPPDMEPIQDMAPMPDIDEPPFEWMTTPEMDGFAGIPLPEMVGLPLIWKPMPDFIESLPACMPELHEDEPPSTWLPQPDPTIVELPIRSVPASISTGPSWQDSAFCRVSEHGKTTAHNSQDQSEDPTSPESASSFANTNGVRMNGGPGHVGEVSSSDANRTCCATLSTMQMCTADDGDSSGYALLYSASTGCTPQKYDFSSLCASGHGYASPVALDITAEDYAVQAADLTEAQTLPREHKLFEPLPAAGGCLPGRPKAASLDRPWYCPSRRAPYVMEARLPGVRNVGSVDQLSSLSPERSCVEIGMSCPIPTYLL